MFRSFSMSLLPTGEVSDGFFFLIRTVSKQWTLVTQQKSAGNKTRFISIIRFPLNSKKSVPSQKASFPNANTDYEKSFLMHLTLQHWLIKQKRCSTFPVGPSRYYDKAKHHNRFIKSSHTTKKILDEQLFLFTTSKLHGNLFLS